MSDERDATHTLTKYINHLIDNAENGDSQAKKILDQYRNAIKLENTDLLNLAEEMAKTWVRKNKWQV